MARVFVKFIIRAHAVYLGGRRKDQSLVVIDALSYHLKIGLEIKLKYPQGLPHIGRRRCDGHEGQDNITFLNVVLYPFPVDGDITLDKMETFVSLALVEFVIPDIQTEHFPVSLIEDSRGKAIADEPIDTQY
jgi:hypothetical protein